MSKDKEKKLTDYERLRVVGKGAFGSALLYRKKEDDLLVIIKVRFPFTSRTFYFTSCLTSIVHDLNSTVPLINGLNICEFNLDF